VCVCVTSKRRAGVSWLIPADFLILDVIACT